MLLNLSYLKYNYMKKTTKSFQSALESEYNGEYSFSVYNKISSFVEYIAMGVVYFIIVFVITLILNKLEGKYFNNVKAK